MNTRSWICLLLAAVGASCGDTKHREVVLLHIIENVPPVTYEHRLTKDGALDVGFAGAGGTAGDVLFRASKSNLSTQLTGRIFELANRVRRSSSKASTPAGITTKELTLWHEMDPPGQISVAWTTNQPDENARELILLLEANHIGDRPTVLMSTNTVSSAAKLSP